MRYRLYLEPEDVEADNPDVAWDKLCRTLLDRRPTLSRIILIDKDGFPIQQGGEMNERK